MAYNTEFRLYPDDDVAERVSGTSWLPPESSNGDELADERTRLMATAATASPQPASPTADDTSWLPRAEPPAQPSEGSGSWLPEDAPSPEPPHADHSDASPPAVLTDDRRQALAIEAYCRELCPPETASGAAAEALQSAAGMSDTELLRHTRAISAKHGVAPSRRARRRALPPECEPTLGRLAARANGELPPDESDALERHLDSCLNCQAAELRTRRAERAFAGIAGIALGGEELARRPAAASEPEPAPTIAPEPELEPVAAVRTQPVHANAAEAPTSEWIAVAPAAESVPEVAPRPAAGRARARRRPLTGALALAAAVAAAAVLAVVALSGGHAHNAAIAGSSTPAPATSTPAHHHKAAAKHRPATTHHAAAKKPAAHHAAPASTASSVVASATPTASSTSSAPVSQSSASSSPPVSSSPPASSAPPASKPSAPPSVSISQPSLGSTSAQQGIGH